MKNTAKVEKLEIDETAPSIKVTVGGKEPVVSIRKMYIA